MAMVAHRIRPAPIVAASRSASARRLSRESTVTGAKEGVKNCTWSRLAPRRLAPLQPLGCGAIHEAGDEVPEMRDLGYRDAAVARHLAALAAARRDERAGEAELAGFLEPRVALAHRADLAGEADLAAHDAFRRHRLLREPPGQRRGDGEGGGRPAHAQTPAAVEIKGVWAAAQA